MASLIDGMTIHSFGEVPIGDEQQQGKAARRREKPDVSTMYSRCESLRWLLIDEGSSASCENLGLTESNLRQAIREAPETYKVRPKHKKQPAEVRSWGGLTTTGINWFGYIVFGYAFNRTSWCCEKLVYSQCGSTRGLGLKLVLIHLLIGSTFGRHGIR